jgi:hypothetical protein
MLTRPVPTASITAKTTQTSPIRYCPSAARRWRPVCVRLTALAVLCLVALAVAPVSPASAAFVWGDAHQLDYGQKISDMSCPTTTQCTVVGATNDETTVNPQTTATVSAVPIASSGNYGGISCWSETQCTAVGDGNEVTFNPQSPNPTTPAPHAVVDPTTGADLVSVSCPAANQCSAVDGTSANEVTFNPTTGAAQTPTAVGTTHGDLTSVTCPTTTECVTVDTGSWEATFDPTSGTVTLAQEVGLASTGGSLPSLSDVICPIASQCSASANNGSVTTFDPNDTTAIHRQFLSPTARYAGIACPTTSLCLTASPNGVLVSFSPGPTSPTPAVALGLLGQGPIVCVSATQCTASSGEGATTFDPENPGNATQVNFTPAVTSISCPSSTACWFGDLGGNFLLATPQSLGPALNAVNGGSILATSCPIDAQCTIAQANGYLRTFYPGTETASTLTYVTASARVTAVDCPTVSTCAVGESNGFATTFDPQTQSFPDGTYRLDAGQTIKGISCADDTHCVAIDSAGAETSFNPQTPRNLTAVTVDPGTALVAVSCPSDTQCTAVDGIGQEVTFNPLPPGSTPDSTTLVSIDSDNALGAISCPDTTECVAVDSAGQSLAGNPQDAATPWDVEPIPGTTVLTGISCPTSDECSAIDSGGEYSLGSFVSVPVASASPTIAGAAVVGQTLTETHAAWSGSPTAYAYQWEDCDANGLTCAPIANAINPSYTVAAGDVGDTIRIVETASNAGGPGAPASSNPTAVIAGPSTATPPTTTPSPAPPVTKRPPDAAQVKAALDKVLAPSGSAARIKALLKDGGYTFVFNAPSAGKLALAWYQVPKGARVPDAREAKAKPKPKPVLVASVSAKIHKAGKIKVKIKLSRIGRKLLKSTGRRLKLTGQDSFTPAGAKQTTVRRTFSVRR